MKVLGGAWTVPGSSCRSHTFLEEHTTHYNTMFQNPVDRLRILRDVAVLNQHNQDQIVRNVQAVQAVQQNRRPRRQRRRKTVWVRSWLVMRGVHGQYDSLMRELSDDDLAGFRNFTRMDPALFNELMARLGPRLTKKDTWYRKALHPGLKLAFTLRHLATGDSYHSLMYGFRVAHNTISLAVKDVCRAIEAEYARELIPVPTTAAEWRAIAEEFRTRWQFPHAVGALDGKHVAIRCPRNGGSLYFNYKGFHSIVLLALVDADYKFLWVDVGSNGSASDAQIFNQGELKDCVEDGTIGFPPDEPLPNDDRPLPYFIIADDAFPLRSWLMKPYSRRNMALEDRIFNYRLSRARRVVENAFGILGMRFAFLVTTLRQEPETVVQMVLAAICLHNLMRTRYPGMQNRAFDQYDANQHVVPGAWRYGRQMPEMDNLGRGNRISAMAKAQRQYLTQYYNSPAGAVPWQDAMVA